MSTDEARGKKRASKTASRAGSSRSKTAKPRKRSTAKEEPQSTVVHTPASPGSEMVLIPVKVLPAGTHKKPADAAKTGEKASVKASWTARRAAKKASRLRRRARRYATKAKGAVVHVRPKKRTRRTTRTEAPAAVASIEIEEAPKPESKKPKTKAAPVRHKRAIVEERSGWLPRPVRNVFVSAFVLLVLMLVGGAVYIFMTGGSEAPVTFTATPASATEPTEIKPRQVAPNAPESAAVQMMSPAVSPGGPASISVKTLPGSACTIAATYTNDKPSSTAAALLPATADDFGNVSWNWVVDTWAPDGNWPVTVTCAHGKKSAMVQARLIVSRTVPASAAN